MRARQAFLLMAAFLVAVGLVLFIWWDQVARWRPHPITQQQATIATAVSGAGWVGAGASGGPKLYVVATRACAACDAFDKTELPKLQKVGVDVRMILIAPTDSTPAERATVAELWVNRSWPLLQAWLAADPKTWTTPPAPPADGDAGRTAVIAAGRDLATQLTAALKPNGVRYAPPLLIWWAKDGALEASAGDAPKTWRDAEQELVAR